MRMLSRNGPRPVASLGLPSTLRFFRIRLLTKGAEYTDNGQDYCEERYRERVLRQLNQRAIKMGMRLVAAEPTA